MTINFDDESTVGAWFVHFHKDARKDWTLGVTREGGSFIIQYRWRYYHVDNSTDPWDGKDRKSWYRLVSDKSVTRDQVIEDARNIAMVVMTKCGGERMFECVRSLDETQEQFAERFLKIPGVNAKLEEVPPT